jgi:G:T-mismatch repair DNA endonuclease (very short patch repair protein)
MDHSEFETKSILRHGHRYDYSKSEVTTSKSKVVIGCPQHGDFLQAPDHHMRGRGCPSCGRSNQGRVSGITQEEFIRRATEAHEDFYDYSKTVYVSSRSKIDILCPIHGEFSTLAVKHIQEKRGCPSCGRVKNRYAQSVMYQDFFDSAVERHGSSYGYAEVSLRFMSDDIDVVCPTHGAFTVVASDHVHGRGCPKCRPNGSSPENELADFIHGLGFDIVRNSRKIIPPLELDVALPAERVAFEFNGIFWHSEQVGKAAEYHQNKTMKARQAGYRLFHVYESDWDLNKEYTMAKIRKILSPATCPDLSPSYPLEEYSGDYHLILRGKPIAGFRVKEGVAIDCWSEYGIKPIHRLMVTSGVMLMKTSLDWPEFTVGDFSAAGFLKHMNVNPGRHYFDRKTLRRLKEKPRQCQGLEYLSVVDSGSTIWEIRIEQDIP